VVTEQVQKEVHPEEAPKEPEPPPQEPRPIHAEVKLLVHTTENGRESIEIRSVKGEEAFFKEKEEQPTPPDLKEEEEPVSEEIITQKLVVRFQQGEDASGPSEPLGEGGVHIEEIQEEESKAESPPLEQEMSPTTAALEIVDGVIQEAIHVMEQEEPSSPEEATSSSSAPPVQQEVHHQREEEEKPTNQKRKKNRKKKNQ